MQELRANTIVKVRVGPFVDVGDGFTPQVDIGDPGTNLAGVDEAELLKHNGAATVDLIAGNNLWTVVAGCDGWYDLTLSATDTDAESLLDIIVQDDSDCLPVHKQFMVLAEAAYDSKYIAKDTGFMKINVHAIDDDTSAAENLKTAGQSWSAARGFSGTALPDASADGVGGLPVSDAGALDIDTLLGRLDAAISTRNAVDPATEAELNARSLPTASYATAAALTTHDTDIKALDYATETKQDIIDTTVDAILVDTETTLPATLSTIAGYIDTEVEAIKTVVDAVQAKTDNLPADPADDSDIDTQLVAIAALVSHTYHADIYLTVDEANTKDEYTAVWFKNGVRVTAGITVPKIQVVKRADGTDLVAETAMTQIGATGSYKYDEDTDKLTPGEAAVAVVTATIDAGGRSFAAVIGRDSEA